MRAVNSGIELSDLQRSISIFACLNNNTFFHTARALPIRRTGGGSKGVASYNSSSSSPNTHCRSINVPVIRAPEFRKPSDRGFPGNGSSFSSTSNGFNQVSTSRSVGVSELDLFLELVPSRMRDELLSNEEIGELIEIVMDLGRQPLARFPSGDWLIAEEPVTREDLEYAISKVGDFSDDNRSGIDHSLHRISAIRNRKLQIIGLTCRVGRAISGSAEIIRDLVEGGQSILVIGPPGVGKTTLIREIARMLADEHKKRVVIVDTSNEIGGDGDVPHSGIGRARRMQVPNVNMQHHVMIEAVENHMPQTIIIDEIGTELEALAASTISQRGVQLVGTAHGVTIESIIKNPSLQLLVGGIESVTLGDDEAKRRKVRKTVLERKGPPTFTCAVEMTSRTECRVHHRLDATVDAILLGKSPLFEVRHMEPEPKCSEKLDTSVVPEKKSKVEFKQAEDEGSRSHESDSEEEVIDQESPRTQRWSQIKIARKISEPVYVYTYKILESDVLQVAEVMGLENEIDVTGDIGTADAILASSAELKRNPWIRGVAKFHQLPVFVLKSNTMAQMWKAVRMILGMDSFGATKKLPSKDVLDIDIDVEDDAPSRKPSLEELDALEEARLAIEYIVIPGGEPVELLPRRSDIIARQLELVESYQLAAENSGTEMNPRLQILPVRSKRTMTSIQAKSGSNSRKRATFDVLDGGPKGTTFSRLPLLPE